MPEFRLFETEGFQRDLKSLGPAVSDRVRSTLEHRVYPVLRATPRQVPSAARLRDWDPPTWRIRIGECRIFYEIDDARRVVSLTAAGYVKVAAIDAPRAPRRLGFLEGEIAVPKNFDRMGEAEIAALR